MITEVGSGSQRATVELANVASQDLAFPGNVVAGNLLIVVGAIFDSPTAPASCTVTDTRSTSYTVLLSGATTFGSGESKCFIAYGIAPSSGACTVTVNPDGADAFGAFSIDEFNASLGWETPPLAVDGGSSTGSSTTPSDTLEVFTNSCLLIGTMFHVNGTLTISPGTGYTQIGEVESVANHDVSNLFRVVSSAGIYTVDWTIASSAGWRAATAAFKEPSPDSPDPRFVGGQMIRRLAPERWG